MNKENKFLMLEWIKETFEPSNDLFHKASSYEIKHWMEDEIGLYVTNEEFIMGLEQCNFKKNHDNLFFLKLSCNAGPIPISKVYPLSTDIWSQEKQNGMRNRLLNKDKTQNYLYN